MFWFFIKSIIMSASIEYRKLSSRLVSNEAFSIEFFIARHSTIWKMINELIEPVLRYFPLVSKNSIERLTFYNHSFVVWMIANVKQKILQISCEANSWAYSFKNAALIFTTCFWFSNISNNLQQLISCESKWKKNLQIICKVTQILSPTGQIWFTRCPITACKSPIWYCYSQSP